MHVGILTEFPSPAVQSGPAIHTQFLKQGLDKRGYETTLMGPDTGAEAEFGDHARHLYPGVPWPTHRKVRIAMPGLSMRHLWNAPKVDLLHCQTNTQMSDYACWIRKMWQVPVLNTHTVHMPTHSHFVLSDKLFASNAIREAVRRTAESAELRFADLYNGGDCLIVQNRFFVDYWRERGVTIPIEVVGRPIDPTKFDAQPGPDPYPEGYAAGHRFLVVCRHDREKRLEHLIDIFARYVFREDPKASLTLVGDGHDHANLVARAMATPFADRFHFPGEVDHARLVDWYGHGDIFTYTSLSETFGNVVNEALWCGLPAVVLNDRMGVAHQVADEVNGFVIEPDRARTDEEFASACLLLTRSESLRQQMGEQAANLSRRSSHPDIVIGRFEAIYERSMDHCKSTVRVPLSQASRAKQLRSFAFHVSRWAWWNATVLGLAYTTTTIGAGRKGKAEQHAETQSMIKQRQDQTQHLDAA